MPLKRRLKSNRLLQKVNQNPYDINTLKDKPLTGNIDQTVQAIEDLMGNSYDLIVRIFHLTLNEHVQKIGLLYLDTLADQNYINETIIEPLRQKQTFPLQQGEGNIVELFESHFFTISGVKRGNSMQELLESYLSGETILLMEGNSAFFMVSTQNYPERTVTEPKTHISVMGPRDSFTENMNTNIGLLRLRLRNTNLWVNKIKVGKQTQTNIAIAYLKDTAEEELVSEVKDRLEKIEMDNVLDSSYIGAALKESKFSVFPTIYYTERPDIITANLLEGRVAIIIDGSPFAIVAPTLFIQYFHSVEDFYQKSIISTFFRILRVTGFIISLFLPAVYIMMITMHSELVPFPLLIKIAAQREGLPFPTWMEAIILCFLYDLMREASIRMPTALGSAISIVGAIVLGEAAIQAGVMSPIMLIVVSTTAIATLVIPSYNMQVTVTVFKYILILIASSLGLFGIVLTILVMLIHLSSLRSFGVSYLSPDAPFNTLGQRDSIYRSPLKTIFNRKKNISGKYPK